MKHLKGCNFGCILIFVFFISTAAQSGENIDAPGLRFEDIIISARTNKLGAFEKMADNFAHERTQMGVELLQILNGSGSSNLNRCVSAYYLGELRITTAANDLARQITLHIELHQDIDSMPILAQPPAFEALVKIGTSSISFLIGNLAESDDPDVRRLSLLAINRIDGEKELTQWRLRHAMESQQDEIKRTRLIVAIKAAAELNTVK